MYVDDDVDPDVLREMAIHMDEAFDMQENQRVAIRAPPPARPPPTSKEKPSASSKPKQPLHLDTTVASPSLKAPSTSSVKTSSYFTAHSSESKPIPDIGLSPRPAPPPDSELDFDITWDIDDPEPSKLPIKKLGSTSARPPPTVPAKHVVQKQPSSPDPYDDLSLDMDVDESFLEQVGMIEQGALGTGTNNKGKGKGKDTATEGRPSVASAKKTPSGSALGTTLLAICPVSPSGAEPRTRMQSSTKRSASAASLSGSTESAVPQSTQSSGRRLPRDPSLIIVSESVMPQSTQSSGRRLPRDPSLIIVSSSEAEDEAPGGHDTARPLKIARRRASKRREMDQDEVADSDVIDISD